MNDIARMLDVLIAASPTAFLGVILATTITYMMFRVRITEQRHIREMDEKQLDALKRQIISLQQELKSKDDRIQLLHDQIIEIATGKASKSRGGE